MENRNPLTPFRLAKTLGTNGPDLQPKMQECPAGLPGGEDNLNSYPVQDLGKYPQLPGSRLGSLPELPTGTISSRRTK